MYLVTRGFQDNGIQRVTGELVVGTGYRTLTKLVELRYLKDVGSEPTSFRCELCGREFTSEDMLNEHYVSLHPDDVEITDDTPPEGDDDDKSNKEGVKDDESINKRKGKSGKTDSGKA